MRRRLGILGGLAGALLAACTLLTGISDLEIDPSLDRRFDATTTTDAPVDPPTEGGPTDTGVTDAGLDACTATTDLSTDTKHCGACNHDCLGGACVFGRCNAVAILPEVARTGGLTVAAGKLFVSLPGRIRRYELDGTSPVDVILTPSPGYLGFDATYLYFVEGSDNTIKRWPLAGGMVETIVAGASASGIAANDKYLYFTHYVVDGGVERVQLDGGGRQFVFAFYNRPEDVELSGTDMVIGGDGVNELAVFPSEGFGAKRILSSAGGPCTFVVENGIVYFGEQQTGKVLRMPVAGGVKEELAGEGGVQVGFGLSANAVYWREVQSDSGTVWRVAR